MSKNTVSKERQRISLLVWSEDYLVFKAKAHKERTTPSALINRFIHDYIKEDLSSTTQVHINNT